MNRDDYLTTLRPLHIELLKMQRWARDGGVRILAIFEGRDAAGKGGAIKRITKHLNPRGCPVVALPKPTEAERSQWYFQRYAHHLPSAGQIVLFDRSWYNRAGLERVMGFCTQAEVDEFLTSAPEFERMLVRSGILVFKLYLSISREEQSNRIAKRRSDPLKQWKLTPLDEQAQVRWDDYTRAEEEMFRATSIPEAPWVWVDANDKRVARIQMIRYLLSCLDYPDKRTELLDVDPAIVRIIAPRGRES